MIWIAAPILIYAGWCLLLFLAQDRLVFPRELAGPAPERAPPETVVFERPIAGGAAVGWLRPAPGAGAGAPSPLVVFFHGNAERIDQQEHLVSFYHRQGVSVLLPEYRGYGVSDGTPSEAAILGDAAWLLERALARPEVDGARLVFHGRSLGGALAAGLARRHRPQAIVLESAFHSAAMMARRYLAPPWLLRHPLDTAEALGAIGGVPVLLMHGRRDEIVPVAHARRLAGVAGTEPVLFEAGHNDFPGSGAWARYEAVVAEFLGRHRVVVRAGSPSGAGRPW